jgi:transcription initiation factor TFIIB
MIELDRLSDKLRIPETIKESAAVLYRKALNTELVKGRSIAAVVAGSLLAACRSSEIPRTLKEISRVSGRKKKEIARCYRLLLKDLNLKMPVEDPEKCVSKIASKAGVSPRNQVNAVGILKEAKRKGIVIGKNPMGFAAAALYVTCRLEGQRRTQNEMAEASDVTEVTVRNRYNNLKKALELEKETRSTFQSKHKENEKANHPPRSLKPKR